MHLKMPRENEINIMYVCVCVWLLYTFIACLWFCPNSKILYAYEKSFQITRNQATLTCDCTIIIISYTKSNKNINKKYEKNTHTHRVIFTYQFHFYSPHICDVYFRIVSYTFIYIFFLFFCILFAYKYFLHFFHWHWISIIPHPYFSKDENKVADQQ